jgi:hypothetical protein
MKPVLCPSLAGGPGQSNAAIIMSTAASHRSANAQRSRLSGVTSRSARLQLLTG